MLSRTACRTLCAVASRFTIETSDTILVDTSLASLILDGELWKSSPSDLRRYRSDMQFDRKPENNNRDLQRSILAHTWAQTLRCNNVDLRMTPTVAEELSDAGQVSTLLARIVTSDTLRASILAQR